MDNIHYYKKNVILEHLQVELYVVKKNTFLALIGFYAILPFAIYEWNSM